MTPFIDRSPHALRKVISSVPRCLLLSHHPLRGDQKHLTKCTAACNEWYSKTVSRGYNPEYGTAGPNAIPIDDSTVCEYCITPCPHPLLNPALCIDHWSTVNHVANARVAICCPLPTGLSVERLSRRGDTTLAAPRLRNLLAYQNWQLSHGREFEKRIYEPGSCSSASPFPRQKVGTGSE